MGIANKYNKGSVFQCNTDGFEYKKLQDLFDADGAETVYPVQGFYINKKSEYGDAPVAINEDCFVNLPQHLLSDVQDIMKDSEAIEQIKAGGFGYMIEEYEKEVGKKKKICYGVKWVDIDD